MWLVSTELWELQEPYVLLDVEEDGEEDSEKYSNC
jgi:hypothetical protein